MPFNITTNQVGQAIWSDFILTGIEREAIVARGARVVRFDGRELHIPKLAEIVPKFTAELAEIDTTGGVAEEVVLVPRKLAALVVASNESVSDSAVSLLDQVGDDLVRKLAVESDRAIIAGTGGLEPIGLIDLPDIPADDALAVTYAGIVAGAGEVRATGARPDVVFVSNQDATALNLAADGLNRPLLTDTASGPATFINGLEVRAVPSMPAGQALILEIGQLLIGLRTDATVEVSGDAAFSRDATLVRGVMRIDAAPADEDAFLLIGEAA